MAIPLIDNIVSETSASTGTSDFTLAVTAGKRSFDDAYGHGATTDVFWYFISNRTANEYEWGTGHMSDATTLVRDTVIDGSSGAGVAVSFSAGTKDVSSDILAVKQMRKDENLSGLADLVASRGNILGASFNTGAQLGLVTNPFFEHSQENGTTLKSAFGSTLTYAADQWFAQENGATLVTSTQNIVTPFSGTAGFKRLLNSVKGIATTAQASPAATEAWQVCTQRIEGVFWGTLGWGTADARDVDIAIILQASVTGTYMVTLRNASFNRSYVTSFALTANTPTVVLLTIPGDTSGTWATDTSQGVQLDICAHSGSTYQIPSLDTWTAGNYISHSSATNWQATLNAFVQVAYCNVFPAGVLPFTSASQITGEALQMLLSMRRPYNEEYRRCQRYWWRLAPGGAFLALTPGQCLNTTSAIFAVRYPVPMRTVPSISVGTLSDLAMWNAGGGTSCALNGLTIHGASTAEICRLDATTATASLVAGNCTHLHDGGAGGYVNFSARI